MARHRQRRSSTQRQRRNRPKRQAIFYAYPSTPEYLDETIRKALEEVGADRQVAETGLRFRPWPDVAVSGRRLLREITDQIDRSVVVACDVTYLNPNVAFELGYAIGKFKRVWLSLDSSIAKARRDFSHSYGRMLGIGYAAYENHRDLAKSLLKDAPWETTDQHILGNTYRNRRPYSEDPTLLYVLPPISTDATLAVRDAVFDSIFSRAPIFDDPREVAGPTLEWYADKVCESDAVLLHMLSDGHRDSVAHNSKASWIAGLAHGMDKPLLMLAHSPFECPTDYRSLLQEHSKAEQCLTSFRQWIASLDLQQRRPRRPDFIQRPMSRSLQLREISLGEPVAENERTRLDEYFVETSAFYEAKGADVSVYVARRGAGKTASFVALDEAFRRDRRNHVCTVQPIGYEVDGLVRLLSEDWRTAERGYLVESLWKFLIYTELAKSVCESIEARPVHIQRTSGEEELVQYVARRSDVVLAPFSQRLNRAVGQLSGTGALDDTESQRARISEHLHIEYLGNLRAILGSILSNRNRVAILIDNLDHQWQAGTDTRALSTLLLGLLRVIQGLVSDFQRQREQQRGVSVSLTIFIRSDIYSHIEPLAAEQDKWPIRRMTWNDPALLMRVIDERLSRAGRLRLAAEEVWASAFPQMVTALSPQEFILRNTLPRPRDVIFLTKEAIAIGVNRNHDVVTVDDMLLARKRYSSYVFRSILAEDDPRRQMMESVLYEFAGSKRELKESEVRTRIGRAQVPEPDVDFYLYLLCDVNFFGIRTSTGYEFPQHESERKALLRVAEKLANEKDWGEAWFQIHPAFHDELQIE